MITVKTYLYPNIAEVQVFDPAIFTKRNRIVYSRPIKVYQGIDNPIQLVVKNQDQKPVNLTGYTVQVDIQDPINQVTAYSFSANGSGAYSNLTIGTTTLLFAANVVNSLDQRFYKITTRLINNTNSTQAPMYVDDNFGVPLDLEVLPAYYASSTTVVNLGETIIDPGLLP